MLGGSLICRHSCDASNDGRRAVLGSSARWPAVCLASEHELSNGRELRFGSHGSLSVDLNKGVWFDHEAGTGGGFSIWLNGRQAFAGKSDFAGSKRIGFSLRQSPTGQAALSPSTIMLTLTAFSNFKSFAEPKNSSNAVRTATAARFGTSSGSSRYSTGFPKS